MMVKGLFWRQTNQNLNPNSVSCVTPEILVNLTQLYLPMYKLKARIMYMRRIVVIRYIFPLPPTWHSVSVQQIRIK